MQHISATPSGLSQGRFQLAHPGSYGIVHQGLSVPSNQGVKISLHFQPHLTEAGHIQAVISNLNPDLKSGVALVINLQGQVEVWVGTGQAVDILKTNFNPVCRRWVKATVAIRENEATVILEPLPQLAEPAGMPFKLEAKLSNPVSFQGSETLAFAASFAETAEVQFSRPVNFFNGRIDSPCLETTGPGGRVLARYDFAQDMSSDRIFDISGNNLHGELINAPTRAVTGYDWDGSQPDWTKATKGYGAIHFHEDDLDDARWATNFSLTLPHSLRSGIYAFDVVATNGKASDLITFIVRTPQGQRAKAMTPPVKVAFVLSTFTYLAYANEQLSDKTRSSAIDVGPGFDMSQIKISEDFTKLRRRTDLGLSLYDVHKDGSGNVFSSAKRPIINFRPGYIMWAMGRPRELSADSMMIGYMERHGIEYDIVTDHDLHEYGASAIEQYDVVLTGSHPEYPTLESYSAYQQYARQGGSLMYLGGNGFYWVAGLDIARPWRLEVRRGDCGVRTYTVPGGERFLSLNGAQGGLWRSRNLSSHGLFGVSFCAEGVEAGVPFRRTSAGNSSEFAWMFKGIADGELIGEYGLGGGASGDETDSFDISCGSPANGVVVATSTGHPDGFGIAPECVGFPIVGTLGTQTSEIRSDMIFYQTNAGGAVFSVGSINWFCSLGWNDYDNTVAIVTGNVISHFLSLRKDTSR